MTLTVLNMSENSITMSHGYGGIKKKIVFNGEIPDINSLFFKQKLLFTLACGHLSTYRHSSFKYQLHNIN